MKTWTSLVCCAFALLSLSLDALEFNHTPAGPIKIGQRYLVSSSVDSSIKISEARLYFKSDLSENFSFMPLEYTTGQLFTNLPAPGASMTYIDYFFVVKPVASGSSDEKLDVRKSSVYRLYLSAEWEDEAASQYQQSIQVMSELSDGEGGIVGFIDDLKTVYQVAYLISKSGELLNFATLSNYSVVSGSGSALAGSSSALTGTSTTVATTPVATTGIGMGTIGTIAGGVALAGAAAGGGGGDPKVVTPPPNTSLPTTPSYSGDYIFTLETQGEPQQLAAYGSCLSGAKYNFSNAKVVHENSSINLYLDSSLSAAESMSGTISNSTASISSGSVNVSSIPTFASTDSLDWDSLSIDFSSNQFSSSIFILTTSELGVRECAYSTILTGTKK